MNLFGKKKTKTVDNNSSQKHEDRSPNHWTYNDDPLLNMEPVFTDDPSAKKISVEELSKQYASDKTSRSSSVNVSDKLNEIKKNLGMKSQPKKTEGALGSIIDRARQKTIDIQNEVLENDPVIAKLQKIEELRRTGGVDENLYTDVNKIKSNTVSYAQRAKDFHSQNSTKPLESNLERVKRLSLETRQRKGNEALLKNNKNFEFKRDYRNFEDGSIFKVQSKSSKQTLEDEVKNKILELKETKIESIEQEVEKIMLEIDGMTFSDAESKEEFLLKKLKEFEKILKFNKDKNVKPDVKKTTKPKTNKKKGELNGSKK